MSSNIALNRVLPTDQTAAIERMISLAKDLLKATEDETNALAMRDDVAFLETSKIKQYTACAYQKASEEFMQLYPERSVNIHPKLQEFIDVNKKLKADTLINLKLLEPLKKNAESNKFL